MPPSDPPLTVLLSVSVTVSFLAAFAMLYVLMQIELNRNIMALPTQLELEEEEQQDNGNGSESNNKKATPDSTGTTGRRRIPLERKIMLVITVIALTLMCWLLLVKSNGAIWLRWTGMFIVMAVFLFNSILDEVHRGRFDRLSMLITCLLFLTMALQLGAYANQQRTEGAIYEGKARIVGYDSTNYETSPTGTTVSSEGTGTTSMNNNNNNNNGCAYNNNCNENNNYYYENANQNNQQAPKRKPASVESVTRTDLEVAWGGAWGCPGTPHVYCQAFVQGALCESQRSTQDRRRAAARGKRSRRHLSSRSPYVRYLSSSTTVASETTVNVTALEEENAKLKDQVATLDNELAEQDGTIDNLELDEEFDEEVIDEVADVAIELENENWDLEEENWDLEEDVDELEDEVATEDEIIEDLDETITDLYEEEEQQYGEGYGVADDAYYWNEEEEGDWSYSYYYDDVAFYDGYWDDQDWDSVWGEYACNELFDTELEGRYFDMSTPPGDDEWPFITIYGNCKTCEAFIVDYYSTEHFQSIQEYKVAGRNYGLITGLSLMISIILVFLQKVRPTAEKEIELLPTSGAVQNGYVGSRGGALA